MTRRATSCGRVGASVPSQNSRLLEEVSQLDPGRCRCSAPGGDAGDDRQVLVPLEIAVGDTVMSLFTTLTTFGTPRDITLDELSVELFFPND